MKKLLLITGALLLLQGCSVFYPVESEKVAGRSGSAVFKINSASGEEDEYLYYYIAHSANRSDMESDVFDTQNESSGQMYSFNGKKSMILSEVVSKMAEQLIFNFPEKYHKEAIALTSIVNLRDHNVTNWLGQTISEQFIHELHIRNLRVLDFKLTGNIQLTAEGEFALTRDWKRLHKNVDVRRILTGTMSRNDEGMILNVRIVNVDSSMVESTSSAFIPGSMFVGGEYDYQQKKYFSRNSNSDDKDQAQVYLVK